MRHEISVPALYCPVPSRISPFVEQAHFHTADWLRTYNLVPDEQILQSYLDQQFAWMAARMYPYASAERLCIISDLDTLLFLIDDALDHRQVFQGKAYWQEFASNFIEIMREDYRTGAPGSDPILAGWEELWGRIRNISTARWRQQFIRSITDMYEAAYWENENMDGHRQINLQEYQKIRQYLGAANVASDTIDIADPSLVLPIFSQDNVVLQQIIELSRNTVCWANDLFSLDKELDHGDTHNLVLILQDELGISLPMAIEEAARLHDADVQMLFDLWPRALIYNNQTNDKINGYIDALTAIMRGNIDWSIAETSRYSFKYSGEVHPFSESNGRGRI